MEWKVSASIAALPVAATLTALSTASAKVAGQCRQDGASGFFHA
jgi:hypothetical protein